jgi:hypothetical protein
VRETNGVLTTYARDAMVEVAAADTPEADRQVLREAAHKLAEELMDGTTS